MAHVQYIDELVKEYLLFRGFTVTLKAFDNDLRLDKDKGFRVDRIVDNILQLIYAYDLNGLRELWHHYEQKMFSKMEQDFVTVVHKMEYSILKLYAANAVSNNKTEKLAEFLSKLAPEIQGQSEWRDWFSLAYTKNPEENALFSLYFTRQWQDTLLVSLHNFLSLAYQAMPQPTLSNYEDEVRRMKQLQNENESLKQKLADAQHQYCPVPECVSDSASNETQLTDDFHQVSSLLIATQSSETTVKSLKNLIRNIGGGLAPTSPLGNRKSIRDARSSQRNVKETHSRPNNPKQRLSSTPSSHHPTNIPRNDGEKEMGTGKRSISLDRENTRNRVAARDSSLDDSERKNKLPIINKVPPFLLLSQDSFDRHKASITQCRFNNSGSMVVSADCDNVLKIWSPAPSPQLMGTSVLKARVSSLDWVVKNERFLVYGCVEGILGLFDSKDYKVSWETGNENNSPLRDSKICSVSCSPCDSSVVCSTISAKNEHKLLLYNIKTKKSERALSLDCDPSVYVTCTTFSQNGQLVVAGCSDGSVRLYDLRRSETVDWWPAHTQPILGLQLSPEYTSCYTLAADNKMSRRCLKGNNQGPTWDATLENDFYGHHPGRKFALDQAGKHILVCYGQADGATIFKITNTGLSTVLALNGHKTGAISCDWATANQCCTAVTASLDGKICVSTLLMP